MPQIWLVVTSCICMYQHVCMYTHTHNCISAEAPLFRKKKKIAQVSHVFLAIKKQNTKQIFICEAHNFRDQAAQLFLQQSNKVGKKTHPLDSKGVFIWIIKLEITGIELLLYWRSKQHSMSEIHGTSKQTMNSFINPYHQWGKKTTSLFSVQILFEI